MSYDRRFELNTRCQACILDSIGLPNRTLVFARKEGSATLNNRLKLNNVLYVLSLKCNLISITKLCKELNCSVTFFDNFCVL